MAEIGPTSYEAEKRERRRKISAEEEGLASKDGISPSLHTEQFEMFQNSFEALKANGIGSEQAKTSTNKKKQPLQTQESILVVRQQ